MTTECRMKAGRIDFIICLTFYNFVRVQCTECNFFNDIKVVVTPKSRVPYFQQYTQKNFRGCFEQKKFDQVIVSLAVVDQHVIELGDHAVHDLSHLTSLSFTGCGIKNISKRAFENLPKLKDIHFDHCNLTTISGGIFNDLPSLEDLSFIQNQISEVKAQAFAAMSSLKQIIFARNELDEIGSLWFEENSNITLLDFSYNKIQEINKLSFRSTPKLKDLLLDYNQIKYVGEATFSNLFEMELLSLRHNKIVELNPNIVGNSFRIKLLYLNANFLNFLSHELLKKISVEVLDLAGNPWKCPCLSKIQVWVRQINATLNNSGYCRGHHIPQCFFNTGEDSCSEAVDVKMTERFFQELKNLNEPVAEECANVFQ